MSRPSWSHDETNPVIYRVIREIHAETDDWVSFRSLSEHLVRDQEGSLYINDVVAQGRYTASAAANHMIAGWYRGFDGGRGAPGNAYTNRVERRGSSSDTAEYRPMSLGSAGAATR